ncbi:MAG: hypothetical protein COC06_07635 [Bacteroidales bacterium]|nr:MAG: hypothetical protein COC06_07635 [Bacteroidales bacterium]
MKINFLKGNLLVFLYSILTVILFSSCSNNKKELVNDLVFLNVKTLTAKYGEPNCCSADNSIHFKLEDGINAMVFYKDAEMTKPEVVRVKGMDFDPELFYNDLGWDLPHLDWQQALGRMTVTGLKGIKNATYNKTGSMLNIVIDNPNIETFGKRKG